MKPLGPTDPQQVGHYRLLGKLGAGGMGSVYLARSDRGRTVAVKLVQPELAAQPEFRQRFQHEVDAARRVGGDWTAPVLDADTEAATPWVATGYVAGPSLHDAVTGMHGPLPERTLFPLGNGLVKALRDIHAAGLVHRDLKPSNVMITIDGPRVIDFGIARALDVTTGGLTRTGAAVGSPGFMSPEQCRGQTLTTASDIFCLGSVLTFAATGRTPFGDPHTAMTTLMLRIVQGEYDLDGVPENIRGVIEDCLRQEPGERPTLDELARRTDVPDPSGDPWLPSALVAHLGRHAVELLDSEDPLTTYQPAHPAQPTQGTPSPPPQTPGTNGMATMASATPPPSPPPGYATPPPSPPPGGAYGYPQPTAGAPAYGYPQQGVGPATGPVAANPYGTGYPGGPAGPAGPGASGPRRNNVLLIGIAAVVVFAIAVVIGVVALGGGSDDEADDGGPTGGQTSPSGNSSTGPSEDPSDDPSDDGSDDSSNNVDADPNATVGPQYVGAWEGEVYENDEDKHWYQRIEITEGDGGDTVATQWTLLNGLLCTEQAALVSSGEDGLGIQGTGATAASPAGELDNCGPYSNQTLTLQDDGTLLWANGNLHATMAPSALSPGGDGVSIDIYNSTYRAPDFEITTAHDGNAGDLALTYDNGSCQWEAVVFSGNQDDTTLIVGPGDPVSGGCDRLPPYKLTWDDVGFLETAPTITFTPFFGSDDEGFTAQLQE
ncbi:serine/threonine-protein kinase [Streptomyces hoynatensis]|uniref:Serine/threonine protein kinase n=1 Tax=Streptomyces hoynatensis TaxID=1141874 RepID=A0A3A9YUT4_9ACTN|nr:serine/threonine-protein kinase [Streptomyces hoynatensis]RKN39549.1 serine/threonine protein kinase [Streptomyces hoynatensis]